MCPNIAAQHLSGATMEQLQKQPSLCVLQAVNKGLHWSLDNSTRSGLQYQWSNVTNNGLQYQECDTLKLCALHWHQLPDRLGSTITAHSSTGRNRRNRISSCCLPAMTCMCMASVATAEDIQECVCAAIGQVKVHLLPLLRS